MNCSWTSNDCASRYMHGFQKKTYRFSIFSFQISIVIKAENRLQLTPNRLQLIFKLSEQARPELKASSYSRGFCRLSSRLPRPLRGFGCPFQWVENFSVKTISEFTFFCSRKNVNFQIKIKKRPRYSEQNGNIG